MRLYTARNPESADWKVMCVTVFLVNGTVKNGGLTALCSWGSSQPGAGTATEAGSHSDPPGTSASQ